MKSGSGLGATLAGWGVLAGLAALFVLRLMWISGHVNELRPVAGGDQAPEFTLPLLQGGEFHMHPGEAVTVLDFWATWCGPCRQELPRVEELFRKRGGKDVQVVAVNIEDQSVLDAIKKIAADSKLTLPIALGGEGAAAAYKVDTLPHLVIVDRQGRIRKVLNGVHGADELSKAIDEAR